MNSRGKTGNGDVVSFGTPQITLCTPLHDDVTPTGAGDVDGPLKVLLSENDACRSGLGLRVPLPSPLKAHRRRDEVTLLGPDGQEEGGRVSNVQGRISSALREEEQTHTHTSLNYKVVMTVLQYCICY